MTVTGTAARDLMTITSDANQLVVDFGSDGVVDAQFSRSDYERVEVLPGSGNDGLILDGSGDVPTT